MTEESLQSLVSATMESIQQMVDVNTVVGDAIETPQGVVIVPVSRVSFGFIVGGSDWEPDGSAGSGQQGQMKDKTFGGGSGAGVTVQPVGFLVVSEEDIHLIPVDEDNPYIQLLHLLPDVLDDLLGTWRKGDKTDRASESTQTECPLGVSN